MFFSAFALMRSSFLPCFAARSARAAFASSGRRSPEATSASIRFFSAASSRATSSSALARWSRTDFSISSSLVYVESCSDLAFAASIFPMSPDCSASTSWTSPSLRMGESCAFMDATSISKTSAISAVIVRSRSPYLAL